MAKDVIVLFDDLGKVTDKAYQIIIENEQYWLPRSVTNPQVRNNGDFKEYRVQMPYWLADQKGFFATSHNGQPKHIVVGCE